MHIHILGICGTFMGSLALLARELGYQVSGSDENVYPPMSTQLQNAGIEILEGYCASHLQPQPDLVVVGNAMKRGIEAVEYMLEQGMAYTSGPQFLAEQVLQHRQVLAVAGTHGKTTTTTMLAWILQFAGLDTGFLIGGVPLVQSDDVRLQSVFAHSSYLGAEKTAEGQKGYFVIEADEYDSAFFDKRSKFVHYRPYTAILNNLEFDHADIFADLNAIQTQFHHMIRMIPRTGKIIMPSHTASLEDTIKKGCWTPIWRTQVQSGEQNVVSDKDLGQGSVQDKGAWVAKLEKEDGSQFSICFSAEDGKDCVEGQIQWGMSGLHNVHNALVAVAAAFNVGVPIKTACQALSAFAGIKRRMELIGEVADIQVYDDFAHHPTAIETTLDGVKKKLAGRRVWAVIEPRSNTMKMGIYKDSLAKSASLADKVIWYEPKNLTWGLAESIGQAKNQQVFEDTNQIIKYLVQHLEPQDVVVIMSNGGFEGIHQGLLKRLKMKFSA